ncbi:ATP-binding cassette domain-containing protein [Alloscardovia venturai]|uniref:ATP-binding cassette domain-containing protein n=1 Tax=Alloscardovia venturai TaxID=1769421 RepID=A0ABW2Y205_9BIFI
MIAKYYPRGKFILLTVLSLLSSAESIAVAFMVASLTAVATNGNVKELPKIVVEVIIFLLIVLISQLGYNYMRTDAVRYVNQFLRKKVLRGILSSANGNESEKLGFFTNDFKLLETNRFGAELNIVSAAFTLILSLTYALAMNWVLTLVFFVGSCIPLVASNFFQKPIQRASEVWSKANEGYVAKTKNFLSGAATLKLYRQEDSAVARNEKVINKLENSLMRMNLLSAHAQTSVSIVAEVGTFLIPFIVGVLLITHHQASLASLFAVMQLSNSFVNPILTILSERNNLSTTKAIAHKISNLVGEKDNDANANDSTSVSAKADSTKIMTFKDISLIRNEKVLSDKISFDISRGKKIAIIGPSGCGKSTLLQFLMTGQYGKAQDITLNGLRVQAGSFAYEFAYASQNPVIFSDSLEYNLTLGAHVPHEIMKEVCKILGIEEVVNEKGLQYDLGANADQLSGGQLARIELARAILSGRSILLLDEINASLDKKTADAIHEYLLTSDLTFIEVIHHYEEGELSRYDEVIDFSRFKHENA